MMYNAKFEHTSEYKMILRDSFKNHVYYGLDEFDSKYLRIILSKFGCLNSFHTIPDRVKMEMAPYKWSKKKQRFILMVDKLKVVQLNRLEIHIVSRTFSDMWQDLTHFN